MSEKVTASYEAAGVRYENVDFSKRCVFNKNLPSQEEVAAYERGRAAGRAEAVAELRAAAQERRDLAHWSSFLESEKREFLSDARALQIAADELEARAKAPAERQDDGERA